jgi:hypothetical protein
MSDSIVLSCPKCGRKLGIPKGSDTIHITCPACRTEWDWVKGRTGAKKGTTPKTPGKGKPRWKGYSERIKIWYRRVVLPPRFSGAHLILALLAGAAIGGVLGNRLAGRGRGSFENMNISKDPVLTGALESTNTELGIDDLAPTNSQPGKGKKP